MKRSQLYIAIFLSLALSSCGDQAGRVVMDVEGFPLLVTSKDGVQDRDFLQVRVYDPERGQEIVNRHVMYTPVRNIVPGDTVLFWNRINHAISDVLIDFGDRSETEFTHKEIPHIYRAPGNYVVSYSTTGPDGEPGCLQMEVKVTGR